MGVLLNVLKPYELRHFVLAAAISCCRRATTRQQLESETDSILAAGRQHQGFADVTFALRTGACSRSMRGDGKEADATAVCAP